VFVCEKKKKDLFIDGDRLDEAGEKAAPLLVLVQDIKMSVKTR